MEWLAKVCDLEDHDRGITDEDSPLGHPLVALNVDKERRQAWCRGDKKAVTDECLACICDGDHAYSREAGVKRSVADALHHRGS